MPDYIGADPNGEAARRRIGIPTERRAVSSDSLPRFFPPAKEARYHGLLATGGLLTPEWLLDAYSHGIFPWPLTDGTLAWFSPDPRAIIEFDELHVSRRLRDTLRSGKFEVRINTAFADVMRGCASAQDRGESTWISDEMFAAYCEMHRLGHAHSVEVWHEGRLAGGTYGLAIGGLFAAESMFYYVTDASKVAVVALVERLKTRGFGLLDIQQLTPHSARLGAKEIRRREYLKRMETALRIDASFV